MGEIIKVKISECGTTAKEVNPMGEKPSVNIYNIKNLPYGIKDLAEILNFWKIIEYNLRTFEIVWHYMGDNGFMMYNRGSISTIPKPNSIQEAKIVEDNKVIILRNKKGEFNDI